METNPQIILNPPPDYMAGMRADITPRTIQLMMDRAKSIAPMQHDGFQIFNGIDGNKDPAREVALVKVGPGIQHEHCHLGSNATLIITKGSGRLLSDGVSYPVKEGDTVGIPKGAPHGFELNDGEHLEFISVQSPPIIDRETGKVDIAKHVPRTKPNAVHTQRDPSAGLNM